MYINKQMCKQIIVHIHTYKKYVKKNMALPFVN